MFLRRVSRPGPLFLVALLLAAAMLSGCSSKSSRFVSPGGPEGSAPALAHTAGLDSDNDSIPDNVDECRDTPQGIAVDAFGCPVPLYLRLTVPYPGGEPLAANAYASQLARMAQLMRKNPDAVLHIEGHSAPGLTADQERLRSLQWARHAQQTLQRLYNVPAGRIEVAGLGASSPLVSNASLEGRRRNQRLEFTLQGHYSAREASPLPAVAVQEPLPRDRMKPSPSSLPAPANLRFAYGGTELVQQDRDRLESLGALLLKHPEVRVHLVGHTDSKGSASFNLGLSRRRAEQVKDMLVSLFSIDPGRITTEGRGEDAPIASNDTEEGRLANRRVSISLERGVQPAPAQAQQEPAAEQPAPVLLANASSVSPRTFREIPRVQPGSSAPVALDPDRQYKVKISINKCKLWLYEKTPGGGEKLVRSYDVATPKPGTPGPEGLGYVTRIDFNPWWVPTENLKRAALSKGKRLPNRVRPGSSANPMGKFKIHLSHGDALRIHGTNKPSLIGRRVSAGCIRMRNDQGLEMAHVLDEGTEVIVVD